MILLSFCTMTVITRSLFLVMMMNVDVADSFPTTAKPALLLSLEEGNCYSPWRMKTITSRARKRGETSSSSPSPCSLSMSSSPSLSSSTLVDTQWKIQLNIGLQPGTWMPKRYPGWAESGARLGLDVEIEFTNTPLPTASPGEKGDPLIGRIEETYQLKVLSKSDPSNTENPKSSFVSENGVETVEFNPVGGWSIQRPQNSIKNTEGGLVKPEGILRFWIDVINGAKRNDVEIYPNTRLIFTTGVWDNYNSNNIVEYIQNSKVEYQTISKEMEEYRIKTKENKQKQQESSLNPLKQFELYQRMLKDSKNYEQLKEQKIFYEQSLPPSNAITGRNKNKEIGDAVILAPNGSIVMKYEPSSSNWLLGSEYLILGTFTTSLPTS